MDYVMCLSCGEFVQAIREDDRLVPRTDECPDCGGHKFQDSTSETGATTSR
jgi:predicted  nucleic acid-binding Zn-ribbon protein